MSLKKKVKDHFCQLEDIIRLDFENAYFWKIPTSNYDAHSESINLFDKTFDIHVAGGCRFTMPTVVIISVQRQDNIYHTASF